MFNSAMLQTMVRGIDPVHSKTLNIRPGQIFQGTITQLYSGQLAQLQLGQTSLSAQLEAQLEKGGRYWFRVMEGEGIPKLKVLENVPANTGGRSQNPGGHQAVLQQLGIPQTQQHLNVLQHLAKLNLPFTKHNIMEGARILQESGLPRQQGLEVLASVIQRGLPLSQNTFKALAALSSDRSTSAVLTQLNASLQQSVTQNGEAARLSQVISSLLAQGSHSGPQGVLKGLLQHLQASDAVLRNEAGSLARSTGLIQANMTDTQFYIQFKAAVLKPENEAAVRQLWPDLFQGTKQDGGLRNMAPAALFSTLVNSVRLESPQSAQQLIQLLNPQNTGADVLNQISQWSSRAPENEGRQLWQTLQAMSAQIPILSGREGQAGPLRTFLQQFGLQHEFDMKQGALQQEQAHRTETLKAQLMQFLNQSQGVSQAVREQAEFLLQRLTGFQLISSDTQGPVQHTVMQIPVKMTDKYKDMTIQWEGRRKGDGTIDDAHCRILFYLQLDTLNETVVDVQIQNRIVSVTVFNENDKPSSVNGVWSPLLKEKLDSLDYKLLSVSWKQPAEDKRIFNPPGREVSKYTDDHGYRGVDVRI